ncbi:hypothetical protein OJF2_31710 [Aquisphaera giovannonii]|uniref:Uncharacterized protein n=1 Tax=Aquisphaera giovannonii TaxID=406548 RepID=A0A5B9W3U1_9BACT|nr:hypothetical protein OJF2_31710 [Aquisphaera giovannonii]
MTRAEPVWEPSLPSVRPGRGVDSVTVPQVLYPKQRLVATSLRQE